MRRTSIAIAVTAALGVFAGTTYAQQSGNSQQAGNSKKQTSQTQDLGIDDDKTPPGQARKEPADRSVMQVPAVRSNGVAVAQLDESFDEALVVRINPDGTRTHEEVQGLDRAAEEVHRDPTPAPAAPVLEEK